MLRSPWLPLALLMVPSLVGAQGTVQARDPRRPPPLEPPPECELWRGHIAGNDPSAEATLQLCTSGDSVTGVFLWSSLESGWDRRTFLGQWLDARQRLVLHDTAMLENHPANGWRLCLADRYELRRVSDGELAGEFWSTGCDDHGTLTITHVAPTATPIELSAPAAPFVTPPTQRNARAQRRSVLGCATSPGDAGRSVRWGWVTAAALAAISARRRRWPGSR